MKTLNTLIDRDERGWRRCRTEEETLHINEIARKAVECMTREELRQLVDYILSDFLDRGQTGMR